MSNPAIERRLRTRLGRTLDRLRPLVNANPQRPLAPQVGFLAGPASWPAELPESLSARQALDLVTAERDRLATAAARDIVETVETLVRPDARARVLARHELADGWPWPSHTAPVANGVQWLGTTYAPRLALGLLAREWWSELDPADFGRWPDPELSHADVASWALAPLNRLRQQGDGPAAGDLLVAEVERYGEIRGRNWLSGGDDGGPPVEVNRVALALLCLLEREVVQTLPGQFGAVFPLDVTEPTRRTLTSLAGADPREVVKASTKRAGELAIGHDDPTTLVFSWDDGTPQVLELPFDDGAPALSAVARRYGDSAIADLLVIYALAWSRARQPDNLWWWPEEHLWLRGLTDSKDNRKRLAVLFDRLSKTKLEARYADGGRLVGPVLATTLTDGTARRLSLHPSLYAGIRAPDGKAGNRWWAAPMALLKLPADKSHGKVHVLAVVAGGIFRAKMSGGAVEAARITVRKLRASLAIGEAQDRQHDKRAGEQLARTLDGGKTTGLLASWEVERGGDLANPDALVVMQPGELSRQIVTGEQNTPFPAILPATGDELAVWLRKAGMTATDLARVLELDDRTVRRAAAYGARPLQPEIRSALRGHLWSDLT